MDFDWSHIVIGPTVKIFGSRVHYWSHDAEKQHITGVFDEAYLELTPLGCGDAGGEAFFLRSPGAITTEMPVLGVQLSQFCVRPEQGDRLEITSGKHRGERFVVKEVRPDGHGGAKLLLNED
jgi:hypothetical protein